VTLCRDVSRCRNRMNSLNAYKIDEALGKYTEWLHEQSQDGTTLQTIPMRSKLHMVPINGGVPQKTSGSYGAALTLEPGNSWSSSGKTSDVNKEADDLSSPSEAHGEEALGETYSPIQESEVASAVSSPNRETSDEDYESDSEFEETDDYDDKNYLSVEEEEGDAAYDETASDQDLSSSAENFESEKRKGFEGPEWDFFKRQGDFTKEHLKDPKRSEAVDNYRKALG
jgi:hypothetical protein